MQELKRNAALFLAVAVASTLGVLLLQEKCGRSQADKALDAYIRGERAREGFKVQPYKKPSGNLPQPPAGSETIATGRGRVRWEATRPQSSGAGPDPTVGGASPSGPTPVGPESAGPRPGDLCDLEELALEVECWYQVVTAGDGYTAGNLYQKATLTAPDGRRRDFPTRKAADLDFAAPRQGRSGGYLLAFAGMAMEGTDPGFDLGVLGSGRSRLGWYARGGYRLTDETRERWAVGAGLAFRLK